MAFFPASCNYICKDCEQNNHSGWCLFYDCPIPFRSSAILEAQNDEYEYGHNINIHNISEYG